MHSASKFRFSDNRQRRLRFAVPQVEVLEDRLQPGSLLVGQEWTFFASNFLEPNPAGAASSQDKSRAHFQPLTGDESSRPSAAAVAAILAMDGRTTDYGAVTQPAMPSDSARGSVPLVPNEWLALVAAKKRLATPAILASHPAMNQPLSAQPLTPVQATVPLISRQTEVSAAPPTHVPVQQNPGGAASQNWATYVTQTATIASGRAVALDNNGNVYVTGSTDGGTTKKAFVAAYDPNGNQLFLTKFQAIDVTAGVNYNHSQGHAIALDGNGNIYVTGQATNPTTRLEDAFIMRLNSSGNVDPTYGIGFDTGGLGNVIGNGIAVTADGTATIVGSARFLANEIFIAQVAANGSINYGNALPPGDFEDGNGVYNAVAANGVALGPDGSMAYISGTGTHPDGSNDIMVTLIDTATGSHPTGFSAVSNPGGIGNGIAVGLDGTVYQTGTTTILTNGQASTFAIAISWNAGLTTTAYAVYDSNTTTGTGIALDPAGNVYLTGTAPDVLGNPRALVDLLDPTGAVVDTLLMAENGSGQEAGWGIAYSQNGTVYVTGDTSSSNLSTDGSTLNGDQDVFLANVGSFMN